MWGYVVSCVSMIFLRGNRIPAVSGSDAARNWKVVCLAATTEHEDYM